MDQDPGRRVDSWQLSGTELRSVLAALPADEYGRFVAGFDQVTSGRLFFSGQGRSGLAAQMSAMRFMHLGLAAHVVGEATAPSVRPATHFVIVSGSGLRRSVGSRGSQIRGRGVRLSPQQRAHWGLATSIVLPAATSGSSAERSSISALIPARSVGLELADAARPAPDGYHHTTCKRCR